MKYINSYKLFEQIDVYVEKIKQDIEDILLELKDLNRFDIKIYTDLVNFTTYRNNRAVIYIALMPKYGYDGFDIDEVIESLPLHGRCNAVLYISYIKDYDSGVDIDEVSEYLLRIKDYLGTRYVSLMVQFSRKRERENVILSEEAIEKLKSHKTSIYESTKIQNLLLLIR